MTTHVGGGQEATPGTTPGTPGLMTAHTGDSPTLLAGRYRLDEQINTDAAGRQIWRGVDLVLRRQVALVVRSPGGDAAAGMLTAAVAVSRVVHPHLAGVYDAIDEGEQAYVVREWVPGVSLRDIVAESPLSPEHATMVAHAVAEAVSALHAAGIVHGNIHPGTVLVADDGRVVLADTRADASSTAEHDVRCVGAILYFSLTGHWPLRDGGGGGLADAARDPAGRPVPLRQVRAGIPRPLDATATELLDPAVVAPPAAALAGELARLVTQGGERFDDAGPIGFDSGPEPRHRSGRKLLIGVTVLVLIAAVGVFIGNRVFRSEGDGGTKTAVTKPTVASSSAPPGGEIRLRPDMVRMVDSPGGDRAEMAGVERTVDGDESTGWKTQKYNRANFGALKPGMGILINLGQPTRVKSVRVVVSGAGATATLLAGPGDPGNNKAGDKIISNFDKPGSPFKSVSQVLENQPGTTFVFPLGEQAQVLVVWISKLPPSGDGRFQISINEITLAGE